MMLSNALSLARKGLRVFPYYPISVDGECLCNRTNCGSAGKHPKLSGFPAKATSDPEIIYSWYSQSPDAGIGLYPESLLIVDVDGAKGQSNLKRFQAEHDRLPETFRVNSGNSNPHHYQLYFRCPNGKRVKNGPLNRWLKSYDSIDIKSGGGGQVAAPGNRHKTGKLYHWDHKLGLGEPTTREDIHEAPRWLTELLGLVDEGWTPPKKPKTRKAQGKASLDIYFEPGSDGELLHALSDRFPNWSRGTRRGIISQAIQFLVFTRELPSHRAKALIAIHLGSFEGNFE